MQLRKPGFRRLPPTGTKTYITCSHCIQSFYLPDDEKQATDHYNTHIKINRALKELNAQ